MRERGGGGRHRRPSPLGAGVNDSRLHRPALIALRETRVPVGPRRDPPRSGSRCRTHPSRAACVCVYVPWLCTACVGATHTRGSDCELFIIWVAFVCVFVFFFFFLIIQIPVTSCSQDLRSVAILDSDGAYFRCMGDTSLYGWSLLYGA